MVKKVLAAVGAGFGALGAVLVIVVAVTEDFVVVELPPVEACSEDYLGTLGIYTATFDPACALTDPTSAATYGSLEKSSSPTTEFWPLFPAQTGFGGALGEVGEFTTCEEFYAATGPANVASTAAGASGLFSQLSAAFNAQYTTFSTTINSIFGGIPLGIAQYLNDEYEESAVGGLLLLQGNAAGIVPGIANIETSLFTGVGCVKVDPTLAFSTWNCAGAPPVGVDALNDNFVNVSNAELGLLAILTQGRFTGTFVGNVGASFPALAGAINLHAAVGQLTQATLLADFESSVFGGVTTINVSDTSVDISSLKADIAVLNGAAEVGGSFDLSPLAALFQLCSASTIAACPGTITLTIPPLLNSTARNPACVAASASDLFAATILNATAPSACTFYALLQGLVGVDVPTIFALFGPGLIAAGVELTEAQLGVAVPVLDDTLDGCFALGLPYSSCSGLILSPSPFITAAEQAGVPETLTAPGYALCGAKIISNPASTPCDGSSTFSSFITAIATDAGLLAAAVPTAVNNATAASLGSANTVINLVCIGGLGATTKTACITGLAALPENAASVGLAAAAYGQLGLPLTEAERIAACKDDDEDIRIFQLAQKLVAVSIAMGGVGAIVGLAAAFLNKTPLAFVSAFFSVAGGVILLVALLQVRSAPVYALVGGDKVDYEAYYVASTGQTLAIVGMALPIIGGIMVLVSAFLNKPGSSSEMASKVDNTY